MKLEKKAKCLRREMLDMVYYGQKGHVGGSMSEIEILTILYYNVLKYRTKEPKWDGRDRFILSKGHNCIPIYIILSDIGMCGETDFCSDKDIFAYPIHTISGIELSTGSLGHGLGVGAGMALAGKLNKKNHLVVVLLGDGECYEGSVWEAAMFASTHNLNNLVAIVDRNYQCATDFTENINLLEPFAGKWKSFGWEVRKVDGNSCGALLKVFKDIRTRRGKPLVVIANTIKGKGISYMEKQVKWHHTLPTKEEYDWGKDDLEKEY